MRKLANHIIFENMEEIKDLSHSLYCTVQELDSYREKDQVAEERTKIITNSLSVYKNSSNVYFLTCTIDLKMDLTSTRSSPGHRIQLRLVHALGESRKGTFGYSSIIQDGVLSDNLEPSRLRVDREQLLPSVSDNGAKLALQIIEPVVAKSLSVDETKDG